MPTTVETLEAEALQLPAADRARLVDRLIASLDNDSEVEEAWAAEVQRRNAEIESGAVALIPGPEVLAKLKAVFPRATCKARGSQTATSRPGSNSRSRAS